MIVRACALVMQAFSLQTQAESLHHNLQIVVIRVDEGIVTQG
jgi:hypothetical protein